MEISSKDKEWNNPKTAHFFCRYSPHQTNKEVNNYQTVIEEKKDLPKFFPKYIKKAYFANFLNYYKNELKIYKKAYTEAYKQFYMKALELKKKEEEILQLQSEKATNSKQLEVLNSELSELIKQQTEIEEKIDNMGNIEENLSKKKSDIIRLNAFIIKDKQAIVENKEELKNKNNTLLDFNKKQSEEKQRLDSLNTELEELKLYLDLAQLRAEKNQREGQPEDVNNKLIALDAKYQTIAALIGDLNKLMEKDHQDELKTMLDDFTEFMDKCQKANFNFTEQCERAEKTKNRLSELSLSLYEHLYNLNTGKSTEEDYSDGIHMLLERNKEKLMKETSDIEKNIADFLEMAKVTGLTKEEADTYVGEIPPSDNLNHQPGVTFIIDRKENGDKDGDKQYDQFNNDLKKYYEKCSTRDQAMKNHFPDLDRYRRLYLQLIWGSILSATMWLLPKGLKHDVLEYNYNAKKYLEARESAHHLATAMYRYCREEVNLIKEKISEKVIKKANSLKRDLECLNNDKNHISRQIEEKDNQINVLQGKLNESERPNLDRETLEKSIRTKRKEKENLELSTTNRDKDIKKLEKSIEKINNDKATREADDQVKAQTISANEQKVKTLTDEVKEMQKSLKELSDWKAKLADNQTRLQELQTEIDGIRKITEIGVIIGNLTNEKEGLEQAVQASKGEVEQKKSEKEQLAEQLRKIQSISDKLKRKRETKEYLYKNIIAKIKYITCSHTNKKEKIYKVNQKTYNTVIKCEKNEQKDGPITFYFRAKQIDYLDVNNQQSSGFLTDDKILFDKDCKPIDAFKIRRHGIIQALKQSEGISDHLFGIHNYQPDEDIEQLIKLVRKSLTQKES